MLWDKETKKIVNNCEDDISPMFNSVFNGVPYINAQARVELHQQKVFAGVMPISVDQTAPLAGRAYFIDESTNSVIGRKCASIRFR